MPLPAGFLSEFSTTAFIETGSHMGEGIAHALEAGFNCIYSVDISDFYHGVCYQRFMDDRGKVHLYSGDSREFLSKIVPTIRSQVTFWLDAHFCGTTGDQEDIPLLGELEVIEQHLIKHHIILIDDWRLMGKDHFPSAMQVKQVLKKINPEYQFEYRDSRDYPNDILVVQAPGPYPDVTFTE